MNFNTITTTTNNTLSTVGQSANARAAESVFLDYRTRKATNTLRQQDVTLSLFAEFLEQAAPCGLTGEMLAISPAAWRGVTWGLVEGFVKDMLVTGYAVTTVNVRLSTVKTYAKLAAKAGAIAAPELAMILCVACYSHTEAKRIDEQREAANVPTRLGNKKLDPIVLTKDQANMLRNQPNTPQGRRDAVLVRLMLDLGLRCSEVAILDVDDVDLVRGEICVYRPKVNKTQTHGLVNGLQEAMASYIEHDALETGQLLRGSAKGRGLKNTGMSVRAITKRVKHLGRKLGIDNLSAHDLRHTWATHAARNGTPLERLRDAGGWNSAAMPLRYVEAASIANDGVMLE